MKKLLMTTTLIIANTTYASCINFEGQYAIEDIETQCKVTRKGDVLFAHGNYPSLNIMAKPGERYGYFLNKLVANDMDAITIEQNDCRGLTIHSDKVEDKSFLIEQGTFPYFGARSPIEVNTNLSEYDLTQTMLITKYTVSSNGQAKVYKNLKYNSSFVINEDDNLDVNVSIRYGKKSKLHETVSCTFTRL